MSPGIAVPTTAPEARELTFSHSPWPAERRAPVSITLRLPPEVPCALLRMAMERNAPRG